MAFESALTREIKWNTSNVSPTAQITRLSSPANLHGH